MNAIVRDASGSGSARGRDRARLAEPGALAQARPPRRHRPRFQADLLVLPDLDGFRPDVVLKAGARVSEIPSPDVPDWVRTRFGCPRSPTKRSGSPGIATRGRWRRVIGIVPGQIVTTSLTALPALADGEVVPDAARDLAKIAVLERHLGTGVRGRARPGIRPRKGRPRLELLPRRTTWSSSGWTTGCVPPSSGSSSWAAAWWSRRTAPCRRSCRSRSRASSRTRRSPRSSSGARVRGRRAGARLSARLAVPVACVPRSVGDPEPEAHRPRAGRRRPLRARAAGRVLNVLAAPDKFRGTLTAAEAARALRRARAMGARRTSTTSARRRRRGDAGRDPRGARRRVAPRQRGDRTERRCARPGGCSTTEPRCSSWRARAGSPWWGATTTPSRRRPWHGRADRRGCRGGCRSRAAGRGRLGDDRRGLGAVEALAGRSRCRSSSPATSTRSTSRARVFAPQKGADPTQVEALSARLVALAERYRARVGVDVTTLPGSGAAGGTAGGLAALGAELRPGFAVVASAVGFHGRLAAAELVPTGEGRLDATSLAGKVVGEVLRAAEARRVRGAVVAGDVDEAVVADLPDGRASSRSPSSPRRANRLVRTPPDSCARRAGARARLTVHLSPGSPHDRMGAARGVCSRVTGQTGRSTRNEETQARRRGGAACSRSGGAGAGGGELGRQAAPFKAAWIYVGPHNDNGCRKRTTSAGCGPARDLGSKVQTTYKELVPEGPQTCQVIESLIRDGNKIIFSTSFGFQACVVSEAKQAPDVVFEQATGTAQSKNVAEYFGAGEDSIYLSGMAGGRGDEEGRDRLHRAVPDPGGHPARQRVRARRQAMRPDAKVKLVWTNPGFSPRQGAARPPEPRRRGRRRARAERGRRRRGSTPSRRRSRGSATTRTRRSSRRPRG